MQQYNNFTVLSKARPYSTKVKRLGQTAQGATTNNFIEIHKINPIELPLRYMLIGIVANGLPMFITQ